MIIGDFGKWDEGQILRVESRRH